VQGDRAEAQRAEQDGDALGFVYGPGEDDYGMTDGVVEEVDEVDVFVLVGDEEEALQERRDDLMFAGGDADSHGVVEGSSL